MGCSFDKGGVNLNDAGQVVIDASRFDADPNQPDARPLPDAPFGTPDATPGPDAACNWGYTPVHVDPCNGPLGDPALTLAMPGTYTYDTDTGVLTAPDLSTSTPTNTVSGQTRIWWLQRLSIDAGVTLRTVGARPLMIVSHDLISMQGTIDASSKWTGSEVELGSGANPSDCPASPPDPGQTCAQHGGSGGGGGAFGSNGGAGGEGGDGHDCTTDGIPGGAGGTALGMTPSAIRGGCAGRDGAPNNNPSSVEGEGGPGGGAIYLVARNSIAVIGTIHAGGAGGGPGEDTRAGGGAGGSGGLIGLEATDIIVGASGVLAANGGGGGGGCNGNPATRGEDGKASDEVAAGGAKEGSGGDGGNGGHLSVVDGQPGDGAERGGGGGGGSVGFILFRSKNSPVINGSATISPTQITL